MKHGHSGCLTKLSSENTCLLPHGGCLVDKQSLMASMDECNELFFQTLAAKSLSFTDYEIITTTIILPETLLQFKWQIL
jgi:hypothetical protein